MLKDMSNGYGENYDGMDQSLGVPSEKYGSTTSVQEIEVDSGERRLNELGYKQELRREMVNPHSIGNLDCNNCMCPQVMLFHHFIFISLENHGIYAMCP